MLKSVWLFGAAVSLATAIFSTQSFAANAPTFGNPHQVRIANPVHQMVMGDFDNDGIPDVATYGIGYDTNFNSIVDIEVHFGNGTNGFKSTVGTLSYQADAAFGMAAADLAGTGQSQLIVTLGYSISIYGWNGTSFEEIKNIDLSSTGIDAKKVAVGNLSGPHSRDIVVSDDFGTVGVVWIPNDGTGNFQAPKAFATGGLPYAAQITLADVNGDGLDDVILANANGSVSDHNGHGGSTAGVLLNNGNGTLSSEVYYGNPTLFGTANTFFNGLGAAVADVDGDGKPDLISQCYLHNLSTLQDTYYLSVNLGNGDGTFQDGKAFVLSRGAQQIGTADFNHDGKADIVTVDYNVSGFTITQWAGSGASLTVARQDAISGKDGLFYNAMTLGYSKADGTFVTFNNDTNVDVLIGTSSQIYDSTNHTEYSQFLVFQNNGGGGGDTGGGDILPPTTLEVVGAIVPNQPIYFSATQAATVNGLEVRVQATTTTNNEASWKDLPDGNHARLIAAGGGVYTNGLYFYPTGSRVYFRAVSMAPGHTNSVSDFVGPLSIQGAQLRIGVGLTSTSDPNGTLQIAHIGDSLTYTFTWTNVGTVTASNLIVETPVPTYIDATSDLPFQFARSNLTFNQYGHYVPESNPGARDAKVWWNVANLNPGAHQSLTLVAVLGPQVRVDQQIGVPNSYGIYSTSLQPAGEATGFVSSAPVVEATIRGPIALSIVPDVTQAVPGGFINYTITITNLGSYTASNVVIADPIPEFTHFVDFDSKAKTGTTFLSKGVPSKVPATDFEVVAGQKKPVAVANPLRIIGLMPAAGLPPEAQAFLAKNPLIQHPSDNSDQVVFYIGNLAKGASASVRLTVQVQYVDPMEIPDHEIKNFDYLGYFTAPSGLVLSTKNESGNIFTPVAGTVQKAPDLALVKTVSCQTNSPGGQFSVILVANNRGASAAQDVFIQDRLPAGAKLVTTNGTVVTSSSPQSVLNAAVNFITIGKSKSTSTSLVNYFVTLDPDGTLTIHGLTLNANNGSVGLFYNLQVPSETPVPSTLVSGTSFVGSGNGSRSVFGTGSQQTVLSVPPGVPSEIPVEIVGNVRLYASQPSSIVTQPTITTNVQATAAQLDALYAKNINATAYVKGPTPTSPPTLIPGVERFAIYYQNFGSNVANNVHVRFTIPANTVFYRAAFFATSGLLPKAPPAGQSVDAPAKLATGDVTFNIGNVAGGHGGYLLVEVLLLPGSINSAGSRVAPAKPLIYSGTAPSALPKPNAVTSDGGGTIVYDGANVPKVGIIEIVPQAVWTNDIFAVQIATFNYGDVNLITGTEVKLQAPAGTQFYSVAGNASILSSNATSLDLAVSPLKHYANGCTVFLRATGAAGSTITLDSLVVDFPYAGTIKAVPVKIRISDQFPAHTTITTVSGAQFVTLGDMVVIPLGQYEPGVGTAIVAGPSSNFGSIANASQLSDDGYGNWIVAGRAKDIPLLNLPVVNGTDTKSALANLATIVGKHGGNIFNGPHGNIFAADGETLINNDNGSIGGTVKALLAAGAQSLVPSGNGYYGPTANGTLPSAAAVGAGVINVSGGGFVLTHSGGMVNNDAHALLSPNAGQIISQDGAGLIGQDGAGLIGQDGAGLIGQDGAGLIGQDGNGLVSSASSSAVVNTASGNLVAAGGGNIVAQGAGN